MKILAIISSIDLPNFTRRTTLEAINRIIHIEVLLYTGVKNLYKQKSTIPEIRSTSYHFWIPDRLKTIRFLSFIEHFLRSKKWKRKFKEFDVVFFGDPNQAWLIPYTNRNQKIVYLIRDPNVLQNIKFMKPEQDLIKHAHLILATSLNLSSIYIKKYHNIDHPNVHYWPNCVDFNKWQNHDLNTKSRRTPKAGVAGNFGIKRTDYQLIDYVTKKLKDVDFEIAGHLNYTESPAFWDEVLKRKNVTYLGIIPFDELPGKIKDWDVGLITDKHDEYAFYMHHNKVYQYLATGIPAVSLKLHDDYNSLKPCVFLAENYEEYANSIQMAIGSVQDPSYRNVCIRIAAKNSSEARAAEFFDLINNSY